MSNTRLFSWDNCNLFVGPHFAELLKPLTGHPLNTSAIFFCFEYIEIFVIEINGVLVVNICKCV